MRDVARLLFAPSSERTRVRIIAFETDFVYILPRGVRKGFGARVSEGGRRVFPVPRHNRSRRGAIMSIVYYDDDGDDDDRFMVRPAGP